VLSFCLFDMETTDPLPRLIKAPVWLHMSGCTAKDTSTDK
jgi:hypothetical protein